MVKLVGLNAIPFVVGGVVTGVPLVVMVSNPQRTPPIEHTVTTDEPLFIPVKERVLPDILTESTPLFEFDET